MNTPEPTDRKDDQKSESQYLTLADKQPSLIRGSGTESGRTMSTRQLSDNLQTTRDGLIDMMRKKLKDEIILGTHGSGSDDDDDNDDDNKNAVENFGMPYRNKKSRNDEKNRKTGDTSGSSLYETTNKKRKHGQGGEFGSDEYDPNRHSGLSSQDRRNRGSNMEMCGSKNNYQVSP